MNKFQRVATSAFICHDGKALIAQRAVDEPFLANHWENVGGSLEWGEHPEQGIVREVQEEAGIQVVPTAIYHAHYYLHEDKGEQLVEIAYVCDAGDNPLVELSSEHQDFKWITREELPQVSPMTDNMRDLIGRGFEHVSQ